MIGREKKFVAIGSDHAGYRLKERLKGHIEDSGYHVLDVGTDSETSCDYPEFAEKVASSVRGGDAFRGVLICGTGVGMGMVANKVPGIRAAVCNDVYCAEYGRRHNDANVLALGARVVSEEKAVEIADLFLATEFESGEEEGSRHARRLDKLRAVERRYLSTD